MPSFYVQNFGCRATQADGAAIERQLAELGFDRAANASCAQVVILNTCTVTAAADQDARASIRRIQRANPDCQIVVTGCYAQRAPEEIAALPGVSQVIGNSHKHLLAEIVPLSSLTPGPAQQIFVSDIFAHTELLAAPVFEEQARTRPNLKVQDGCDNRCSFCVIPSVRGQSRSLPTAEVLRQVNSLVDSGYREVVISGINLGRWGRDLLVENQKTGNWKQRTDNWSSSIRASLTSPWPTGNDYRLEGLVRAILGETSLEKLRISSVEPMDWSDEFIALMASSPRIAKHAHVPMQSGSDAVLRRMHRKYRPWHYREKIEKIRAAMPGAAIGADVMVGFPGETEAEFEETRRLIEDLPLTYLHVFTYSARPGTPAATLPNQVPAHIARDRNRILRELAAEKKNVFMRSFIGTQLPAITLNVTRQTSGGEFTETLTDNYLKLQIRGNHEPNRWIVAQVETASEETMLGSRKL